MRIDNRTTYLRLVNRPAEVPAASLEGFFANYGVVESVEEEAGGSGAVVVKFAERRMAEKAKAAAKFLGNHKLELQWHDPRLPQPAPSEEEVAALDAALFGGGGEAGGGEGKAGGEDDGSAAMAVEGEEQGAVAAVAAPEAAAAEAAAAAGEAEAEAEAAAPPMET